MSGAPGRPFRLTVQTLRERELQQWCLRYLSACRLPAWRCNVAAQVVEEAGRPRRFIRGLPRGHPDIAGVIPPAGRALYVEVKSLRGTLTPHQAAWQDRMRQAGAVCLTVKSIEELRQGLRAVGVPAP